MTRRLRLRTIALGLVLLLILVMANQVGFVAALGKARLPLTIADVVLGLALVAVVLQRLSRRAFRLSLPPLAAFVLVGAAVVALLRSSDRLGAAREVLQLVECFLVAWFVFVNVAETSDLIPFVAAFAVATAAVILWGGVQYFTCPSVLDVRAGFLAANHHVLGAFLALALPFLYGLALHARLWWTRIVLLLLVVLGLVVNLSGGTLLVTLVVLGVQSALRGQRALIPYVVALGLALAFGPRLLPRPHHTDALVASVAVTVEDNFLLSDRQLYERARELLEPTRPIPVDKEGTEREVPAPRPLDAARLLRLLNDRRPLEPEEAELQVKAQRAVAALSDAERAAFPLDRPQVARRYQLWNAAVAAARTLWRADPKRPPSPPTPSPRAERGRGGEARRADLLFGCGLDPYHESIKAYLGERSQYRTDEPEVFNVAAAEPFTHNLWLKTFIQTGLVGLLALAWLMGGSLGRAVRLYRDAHGELALGVALGALGGVLGFALSGVFTEAIVRGLVIPFVFVLAGIPIAERIVHGDRRPTLEKNLLRD